MEEGRHVLSTNHGSDVSILFHTGFVCVKSDQMKKITTVVINTHSPPQRLSDSTGENHVRGKERSLCHKMCGSRHKSGGSWHVQQQQRFRLKKENLCSDRHVCHRRFYHGAKRWSRAGSCSGFRQVSHRTGTITYWRLVNQFSCLMLKVRKFHSLLGQSALPLAICIIRSEVGLIQTPYFILISVPLWVIYWKFEWEFF